jgi:hypothetical protein
MLISPVVVRYPGTGITTAGGIKKVIEASLVGAFQHYVTFISRLIALT